MIPPPSDLKTVQSNEPFARIVHSKEQIYTVKETQTVVVQDNGNTQMILTRDQTDVFRTSVGLQPHPRLKHHTTEGTRPAEMLCENCNASNPYGLLFCQVCHVKMKDTTFQDGALNTIITQATRTVRETISILYRAGGDAAHNYRGHRSMEGDMGKRARRHARKAEKLGYAGIADRFARDIQWRMSLLEGGHTPQTISLYIERSLQDPQEINMSWRQRQAR